MGHLYDSQVPAPGAVVAILLALVMTCGPATGGDLTRPVPDVPGKPLTLREFVRRAQLNVILMGSFSARTYSYRAGGLAAGDVLEDMSEFYGMSWRRAGAWCILEPLPESADAAAPELVEWLEANKGLPGLSFDQVLAIARYDYATVRSLARDYPVLQRLWSENWPGLRLVSLLTTQQRAAAMSGRLKLSDLTQEQTAALNDALDASDVSIPSPNDFRLLLRRQEGETGHEIWSFSLEGPGISCGLMRLSVQPSGVLPPTRRNEKLGRATLRVIRDKLYIEADAQPVQDLLHMVSEQTKVKLAADSTAGAVAVSVMATGVSVDELKAGLASALEAEWREANGVPILMLMEISDGGTHRNAPPATTDSYIDLLLARLSLSDRELTQLVASDPEMYDQLSRRGTVRYAIEAYASLPIAARSAVRQTGRWQASFQSLPPTAAVQWYAQWHSQPSVRDGRCWANRIFRRPTRSSSSSLGETGLW